MAECTTIWSHLDPAGRSCSACAPFGCSARLAPACQCARFALSSRACTAQGAPCLQSLTRCAPACLSVCLLQLTHNSYHLRFELPGGVSASMPVASCLLTKALLQGPGDDKPKVIVRPYTPVSAPDAAGHLDLVIKAYPTGDTQLD